MITKANRGKTLTKLSEIDTLVKAKKSIIWNDKRFAAAVIECQQYRKLKKLLRTGKLCAYIKNKE